MASLVIRNAASIVPFASGPVRGDGWASVEVAEGADVECDGDRVVSLEAARRGDVEFDATGCTVVPGFVDCHTHLPFYGWRADEDTARLSGVAYEKLHREERGIYRSARLLADAADEDVLRFSAALAREMLRAGTTTFECKSGYGLTVAAELRQLRLARALAERVPQRVAVTCLAAHAVPHGKTAGEWVGEAASDLLPAAAEEGLAVACDIYVESIAFTLEHAARLSESAGRLGMAMRVHADQLEDGQAGSFAARWGFATADHLNHTSLDAAGDIAASDTVAVLLPGATFTLRQASRPPARDLVDAGAVIALGTDLNPGTSPIHSIPFAIALACRLYGLRPVEALGAATINAAAALGLADEVGGLGAGKRADAVVLDVETFDEIAYRPDRDPIVAVVCGGRLEHVAPDARARVRDLAAP